MNEIRQSLKSQVEKFIHDYKSLTARTCGNEDAVTIASAMRDCIIGFVNWIYESERYFGKQYEEVAKFGWIFMNTGCAGSNGDEVDVP